MIAIFVDSYSRMEAVSRHLQSVTREVDGPFRMIRGEAGGAPVDLYAVEGGGDLAYAAGRLAIRRGMRVLVPITEATASRALVEELELEPGGLIAAGTIWDLKRLVPLLRVLGNSCVEMPMELPELLPKEAVHEAAQGAAVGTLPFRVGSRFLARALHREREIALLDLQMAGYAAAAKDGGASLRGFCRLARLLGKNGEETKLPLQAEREFEESMAALLGAV